MFKAILVLLVLPLVIIAASILLYRLSGRETGGTSG
jgi:hypothetical protein